VITTLYRPEIELAAQAEMIDADLVEALVLVESGGHRYAFNPEPRYPYLWNVKTKRPFRPMTEAERVSAVPPSDFPTRAGDRDNEWVAQKASWGLMQIMGAVARERGFIEPYLTELTDPETNLFWGCGFLGHLLEWANGDIHKALAAWNAGTGNWLGSKGQAYANLVDKKLRDLQQARL